MIKLIPEFIISETLEFISQFSIHNHEFLITFAELIRDLQTQLRPSIPTNPNQWSILYEYLQLMSLSSGSHVMSWCESNIPNVQLNIMYSLLNFVEKDQDKLETCVSLLNEFVVARMIDCESRN